LTPRLRRDFAFLAPRSLVNKADEPALEYLASLINQAPGADFEEGQSFELCIPTRLWRSIIGEQTAPSEATVCTSGKRGGTVATSSLWLLSLNAVTQGVSVDVDWHAQKGLVRSARDGHCARIDDDLAAARRGWLHVVLEMLCLLRVWEQGCLCEG
jgi:hypothetical protein